MAQPSQDVLARVASEPSREDHTREPFGQVHPWSAASCSSVISGSSLPRGAARAEHTDHPAAFPGPAGHCAAAVPLEIVWMRSHDYYLHPKTLLSKAKSSPARAVSSSTLATTAIPGNGHAHPKTTIFPIGHRRVPGTVLRFWRRPRPPLPHARCWAAAASAG
jgi:hypothetical protein